MDAIVYTSNTGFTAQYARLLGERTHLPVHSLNEAKGQLAQGAQIVYLGWLMAGTIKGYREAAARYRIQALCGVGMDAGEAQLQDVRRKSGNGVVPTFLLPGGFDMKRLRGMNRLAMTIMGKVMTGRLEKKPDKTAQELQMLSLMRDGGSLVSEEHLAPILALLASRGQGR